ncbi:Stm1p [Rhodotorula paludigena]|uniref:Hyaluronan/mRNA-binding protein domain-containing protein n=1 Tax=Rhodotorula paludigena TaxID=86838 RepID=A0AAV5GQ43_9BASI|nr:hypothetical protein Rhopal_004658-T1 [Rhodotorula paludigena]
MSVFSANSFAALGDGDDYTPAAAPAKAAPAPAPAAAPKAAPQQQRSNAPRGGQRGGRQADREFHADVPAGEGAKEDRAKNFARGGGRGGRASRGPGGNPRGNAGTYLGGNRPRRENGGGRPFDRQSQTGRVDSEKAEAAGWGAEEGKKELEAEQLGDADAKAETPAEGAATPVREAPIEEEDNSQTYEEYLAAQAEKKLQIAALPEARKANEGDDGAFANSKAIAKKGEAEEEWLFGAPKAASNKAKKQKEGKTFLEVEFTSRPPRRDTRERESTRGGRPSRGRGEGRGRGGARGGAPRGAPRSAAPAVPDASAFPALA